MLTLGFPSLATKGWSSPGSSVGGKTKKRREKVVRNFHNFLPLCLIKISALRALLSGKSSNSLESDSVVCLTIFHSIFHQTFARWELPSRQSLVFYVNEICCLHGRGSLAWKSLIFVRRRAPPVLFFDLSTINIVVLASKHDIACSSVNILSLFPENDNMPATLHRLLLCCCWHSSSRCVTSKSISFVTWQRCQNQNHLKRK